MADVSEGEAVRPSVDLELLRDHAKRKHVDASHPDCRACQKFAPVRPQVPKVARKSDGEHGLEIEFDPSPVMVDLDAVLARLRAHLVPDIAKDIEREFRTGAVSGLARAEAASERLAHTSARLSQERDEARRQLAQAREGYWPAAKVLEALRTETDFYEGKVGGSQEKQDGYALGFYEAADFLERRFSGEGAS